MSECPGVRPILATTEYRNFPVEIPASGVWLQGEGDLGARLERIISHGLLQAPAVMCVGADSPILTSSHLLEGLNTLHVKDAVIGPCEDGGFYLLGLRRCPSGLFTNIRWSSSTTCDEVKQRLHAHGFTVGQMEMLFDIDVIDDLERLYEHLLRNPQIAPATREWYSKERGCL